MGYKLSIKAEIDLEEIWFYTFQNCSIEQADRYIKQILNEIEYLSKNPNTGKDYSSIRKGYKRAKINSHLIFYRMKTPSFEIEIIRVLHEQMDIEERLND